MRMMALPVKVISHCKLSQM